MYDSVIIWLFYNASQSSDETSFHLKKEEDQNVQPNSIHNKCHGMDKGAHFFENCSSQDPIHLILKMCQMGAGILNKVKTVFFFLVFFYIKLIFRCDCVHLQIAFLIWQLLSKQSIYFYKVHGGDRRVGSSFF